jgi:ketosteroid isomerase-like protein
MSNLEIIQAHYDASSVGNLEGMVKDFSPNMSWTEAAGFPLAGTYVGTQAIIEGVFARIQSEFDGFRVEVDELLDAGSRIVCIGYYSASHHTTGKSFRARFVHIWTVENSQITEFEQVVDSSLVVESMR